MKASSGAMGDLRHELQSTFESSKRHGHYGDVLLAIHAVGFRNHTGTSLNIWSPITAICGVNGTGKSTLLQLAAAAYQSARGQRFYEGIGNMTPADVYYGRREEILRRRKAQKQATLESRFRYNLGQAPSQTRSELMSER